VLAPVVTGYLSQSYGFSSMFVATAIVTLIGMVAMLCMRPAKPRQPGAVAQI
jgi:MFS transporter, ACS family, hexuronate transporter